MWLTRDQVSTVTNLSLALAQVTDIARDNMLLLAREGQRLDTEDSLDMVSSLADQPDLYLYSVSPCSYNKVINIPDLVKLALTDTKRTLQDYHLRKLFAQGYHFITEIYQNIRHMVTSLKVLDTFLRTKLESITDGTRTLGPDKQRLEVKWEMFKESFQVNIFCSVRSSRSSNLYLSVRTGHVLRAFSIFTLLA